VGCDSGEYAETYPRILKRALRGCAAGKQIFLAPRQCKRRESDIAISPMRNSAARTQASAAQVGVMLRANINFKKLLAKSKAHH
jgi:hypothetical protein